MGHLLALGPLGTPELVGGELFVGQLSAPGPLGTPALHGFHDFSEVIGEVQTRYVLDITGTPTLRIPMSSWQCTLHSVDQSYLQAVIPAAASWAETLVDRQEDGESFQIRRTTQRPDGNVMEYLMAEAPIQQVRIDRGPERYTVTLVGYAAPVIAPSPATREVTHIQMVSSNGAYVRLRGAINWQLQPGDTATGADQSFSVRYVSYYVGEYGTYMDVGS